MSLHRPVAAAEGGQEVIITRDGDPAVRLVAIRVDHPPVRLGALAGQIELGEDFALCALGEPERLTDHERGVLIDPAVDRRLSPVSVREAAIKRELGRLHAPRNLSTVLAREFRLLAIDAELLEVAAELPRHHGDPFDRVLVAHALRDDFALLTRDEELRRYGVRIASSSVRAGCSTVVGTVVG